jgi:hypothetical protein
VIEKLTLLRDFLLLHWFYFAYCHQINIPERSIAVPELADWRGQAVGYQNFDTELDF